MCKWLMYVTSNDKRESQCQIDIFLKYVFLIICMWVELYIEKLIIAYILYYAFVL